MSDEPQGPQWWQASDEKWYPPELHPSRAASPTARPGSVGGAAAGAPTTATAKWAVAIVVVAIVVAGAALLIQALLSDRGGYVVDANNPQPMDAATGDFSLPTRLAVAGLEDMEEYSTGLSSREGTSFDNGNCFFTEKDNGHLRQAVVCGPFEQAEGAAIWRTIPWEPLYSNGETMGVFPVDASEAGAEWVGFTHRTYSIIWDEVYEEHFPLPEDVAATLVHPDGVSPRVETVVTTTAPPAVPEQGECSIDGSLTIDDTTSTLDGAEIDIEQKERTGSKFAPSSYSFRATASTWDDDAEFGYKLTLEWSTDADDPWSSASLTQYVDEDLARPKESNQLDSPAFTGSDSGDGTWEVSDETSVEISADLSRTSLGGTDLATVDIRFSC